MLTRAGRNIQKKKKIPWRDTNISRKPISTGLFAYFISFNSQKEKNEREKNKTAIPNREE